MRKSMLMPLLALLLVGCNVKLVTQVKESYFVEGAGDNLGTALLAEVTACQDYKDSRKDSDSLTKAKEQIPQLFEGAEFKECYRENMNSWAVFRIDIALFRGEPSGDRVAVYRTDDDLLGFYFPAVLDLKMKEMAARQFVKLKPSFAVKYVNDSDQDLKLVADNVYLESGDDLVPQLDAPLVIQAGEEVTLVSSDILIDYLREHRQRGALKLKM